MDPTINFGKPTVNTGYDDADTSIVLSSGHGAKLPSTFSYNLVWWNATDYADPADDPNVEIVRCTERSTDTLTVTRAQEGTAASTKNTGGKTYKMALVPTKKMIDDIAANLPRSYLAGLNISTDTDADHDLNIEEGAARDVDDSEDMVLASEITKQIDGNWAVGDDAPGLDTGTVANSTTYHIFLVKRTDTGVVDVLFSLSATSPTMPTNYDKKRFIGSRFTDGSANFVKVLQKGDVNLLDAIVQDFNSTDPGTSATARTLSVPIGRQVQALFVIFLNEGTASCNGLITSLDQTDNAPSSSRRNFFTSPSAMLTMITHTIRTNTSGQIRTRLSYSDSSTNIKGYISGWIDRRGRDD